MVLQTQPISCTGAANDGSRCHCIDWFGAVPVYPIDVHSVQDMQEKVQIKLGAAASSNSRKPDRVSSRINDQWIIRDMNGYKIWILMDWLG